MAPMVLALLGLGPEEIALALVVIVLLFGATKIPELARSLGRAKGEFEKGSREGREMAQKEDKAQIEDAERERVLKAAREMGIPTEGRSLADIKADLRAKVS